MSSTSSMMHITTSRDHNNLIYHTVSASDLLFEWLSSLRGLKDLANVFLTQIRADFIDTFACQLRGTGVAVPPQCVALSRQCRGNAPAVRVSASATKHKFKPLIRQIKGLELVDSSFNSLIGGNFRWHVGNTILAISFGSIGCEFKSVLGVWWG